MQSPLLLWGVGTGRTFRAHWALQFAGVDYETRAITSRSGETQTADYLAMDPRGKIPVLQHGELTLSESGAIVSYVGEVLAPESRLVPAAGTPDRARYDQWCFFVLMELDAHTLYVLRRHEDLAELYGEAPAATKAAREYWQRQAEVAEAALADGRPYLLGETLTGADIHLQTCLTWAHMYGEALPPNLDAFRQRLSETDAYQRAFQVNFPPEVLQQLLAARQGRGPDGDSR